MPGKDAAFANLPLVCDELQEQGRTALAEYRTRQPVWAFDAQACDDDHDDRYDLDGLAVLACALFSLRNGIPCQDGQSS